MTITEIHNARAASASDINEHMPRLRELALECDHITEFGVRYGNSTVAFLAGLEARGGVLISYDINQPALEVPTNSPWSFTKADTSTLREIDPTDLLFIDTWHSCAQVVAELKHGNRARKYIVFHDTVLFGSADEGDGKPPGIMHAILCFLAENPHWRVWEHYPNNCGLLVLGRDLQLNDNLDYRRS